MSGGESHWTIRVGDCLDTLRGMPDASVDAVVTDPPYGLGREPDPREVLAAWLDGEAYQPGGAGFMGKAWDAFVPSPVVWSECLRVLKPGGHLLAFAGSRTYDWIVMGVRLAGFEVRDQLMWLYGSGFSKGFNMRRIGDDAFCSCADCANPIPYNHGTPTTEHELRPLRRADLSAPVNLAGERGQVLLASVPEQGAPEHGTAWPEPETAGREQPGMEGRIVHRTRQGVSDDPSTGTSQGEGERLRVGAHPDRRGDARATTESGRSGAPHQPRPAGQPARESEGLREPRGALGSGAPAGHMCGACGKLPAEFAGFGTGLKPAHEPIVLARKPLVGTVAHNVTTHGTGAINVDGCRVGAGETVPGGGNGKAHHAGFGAGYTSGTRPVVQPHDKGRWPANVLHDGSPEVLAGFPVTKSGGGDKSNRGTVGLYGIASNVTRNHDANTGSAARFFYHAKASRAERERGLLHREPETVGDGRETPIDNAYQRGKTERRNVHPTVKPVSVMRWLVRLVTPPGGVVLDPFTGSGTTGIAATIEGFRFIGCELSHEYAEIARARIAHAAAHPHEWDPDADPPADDTPSDDSETGQTSLLDLV